MRKLVLLIGFHLLFILKLYANADSTGVKYIDGKLFVLHKVEKGQGLYAVARRYGSTPAKIQEANPNLKSSLTVGEIILVPYSRYSKTADKAEKKSGKTTPDKKSQKPTESPKKEKAEDNTSVPDCKDPIYHVVLKKETLTQIAENHKITLEQLKSWNSLDGGLKVGEKVIVGFKAKQKPKTKPVPKTEVEEKEDEEIKPIEKPKTEKQTQAPKTKAKSDKEKTKQETEKKPGSGTKKEVTESGMGSWVDDGSIKSEVNLAMHKTAPVGTIIRLKNPMNGKIKYVKVIGELPKTEENENILIKIGKSTAEDLDIRDKNFRVEMTYSIEQ